MAPPAPRKGIPQEPPKKPKIDYTQVRVLTDEDAEKTERLMKELQEMIRSVRREYDLWFNGTTKKPPYELRNRLDNHVRLMRVKLPKRTADQFKLAAVLQQYQTMAEHWDKSQRKAEEGGLAPWLSVSHKNPLDELQAANERRQEEARAPVQSSIVGRVASPDQDVEEIRRVFNSFAAAKRKVGEAVADADFDKFRAVIAKQTKALVDSGKATAVDYRVEIQDGKVAIKAKAIK
jgi:hypothetical protein